MVSALMFEVNEGSTCAIAGIRETEHNGFDGDGYFNGSNARGAGFSFAIHADNAGSYALEIRYANGGSNDRGGELKKRGDSGQHDMPFPPTSGWDMWGSNTVNIDLDAGDNVLDFAALGEEGLANIDHIKLTGDGLRLGTCPEPNGPVDVDFMLGMDISSIPELRDFGVMFVDTDGQAKNMLALLKNHGVNFIRLRTFVNPYALYGYAAADDVCSGRAEPYNDKDHLVAFAQEIKAAGLGLLLDFHYSDSWTDADSQVIPEAWRYITSASAMAEQVYNYTHEVMTALRDANALPEVVQVGNEITGGMLTHIPTAESDCWGTNLQVNALNANYENWDNLATYLKAGISAVKAVSSDAQIMMHIENTHDVAGMQWWVNNAQSRNVPFDILGLSIYEPFQGPSTEWETNLLTMANAYPNLKFVFAEYNQEITLANEIMKKIPDNRGLGTFFWEPTQSGYWGEGIFTWDGNTATAEPTRFGEIDAIADKYNLR